jgi:hypothetical protein
VQIRTGWCEFQVRLAHKRVNEFNETGCRCVVKISVSTGDASGIIRGIASVCGTAGLSVVGRPGVRSPSRSPWLSVLRSYDRYFSAP